MPDRICAFCGAPARRGKYCSRRCMADDRRKERVKITCPCGAEFELAPWQVTKERKYCSKTCAYRYRTRPSGLKYEIRAVNRAWRKPGDPPNATSFKRGQKPWNEGVKGTHFSPATEFKPDTTSGPANIRWGGGPGQRNMDRAGYATLHSRVKARRGRASEHECALADETCKGRMEWANVSREYLGVDDFMPLCQSHHGRYDCGTL
jgi:hypothetical protein